MYKINIPKNGCGLGFRKGRIKPKFCKDGAPRIIHRLLQSYLESYYDRLLDFETFKRRSKEEDFHDRQNWPVSAACAWQGYRWLQLAGNFPKTPSATNLSKGDPYKLDPLFRESGFTVLVTSTPSWRRRLKRCRWISIYPPRRSTVRYFPCLLPTVDDDISSQIITSNGPDTNRGLALAESWHISCYSQTPHHINLKHNAQSVKAKTFKHEIWSM